jgi:hypothetical protein
MSEATVAVKALASAIRLDQKLEFLEPRIGFKDEAGVALAEALMVNKILREIDLRNCKATLGVQPYEAFSAMLRVNTSLVLLLHMKPLTQMKCFVILGSRCVLSRD